jgi:hypothetical protein
MKKCSYCGAEYPDNATACVIDQTSLEKTSLESFALRFPTFAFFSEYKIPVSLIILSYLFFIPSSMCFVGMVIAVGLFLLPGNSQNGWAISAFIICVAVGIFFLRLSRGLRRCSRGWRTCALIFIWWGFIGLAFDVGRHFFTHQKDFPHETTIEFWIDCAIAFVFQWWQYWILMRPDIRELFYNEP